MIRVIILALGLIPLTALYWFIIFFFSRWWPYSRFNNWLMRSWCRFILIVAGVKVKVENLHYATQNLPAIILGNHQSLFDVAVLTSILPVPVRYLAKKELFRIPLFGGGMKAVGIIPVDRQNRLQAIESINRTEEIIRKNKLAIVAFPEGTRSPDGIIRPFKKGLFILAINTGIPIVPFSISGTRFIMKKGQLKIKPGIAKVVFHPPVLTRNLTLDDKEKLIEEVYNVIRSGYDHKWGEHDERAE